MPQTPGRGFRYPAYNVAADIPQDIRNLAEDLEAEFNDLNVGGYSEGALGDRPAAAVQGRIFRVSTGTGAGRIFIDTGTAWAEPGAFLATMRAVAAGAADVPVTARAFSTGQTGNLAEFQNSAGTVLASIRPTGRLVLPVDPVTTFNRDSANGNRISSIVVTSSGVTIRTITFTYGADGIATVMDAGTAEGRTVTSTFTYSSGLLQSISKAVS